MLNKRIRLTASALALSAVIALSGCSAIDAVNEATDAATDAMNTAADAAGAVSDMAGSAAEAVDALANFDWTRIGNVVVRDAATGDIVAEPTDGEAIQTALEGLSDTSGVALTPDSAEEYVFEVKPDSPLAEEGADAADLLVITTYEGSDVVKVRIASVGIELCLTSPGTADALRQLVA